jgi:hypothetical protein
MKSEHNLFEEMNTPSFYMEAARAVFALKEKAFKHEVYFKSPLYEFVENAQMFLKINGTQLPVYPRDVIADSIDRIAKAERIEDASMVKTLIKEYVRGDMRVYWLVMWLFADECVILKTESGISLFAFLGDVGVMNTVFTGSTLEPCCENDCECVANDELDEF